MQFGRKFQCPHVVAMCFVAASLFGCSGSQQDQESLENEYSQYGGNYEQQGQGGYSNYGDNNVGGNEYANYETDDGDAYNSEIGNDTDEYAEIPVENMATNTVDATLNGSGAYDTAAPVNAVPVDYGQPVATPVNYGQQAAAAPIPAGATAPIPGGRVRYVVQGGAQIIDQGGTPVGSLVQGDHPLTWEENGMFRITQGMYVEPAAVSDQGVGRPMSGSIWK